jgi:hypothetical protein
LPGLSGIYKNEAALETNRGYVCTTNENAGTPTYPTASACSNAFDSASSAVKLGWAGLT